MLHAASCSRPNHTLGFVAVDQVGPFAEALYRRAASGPPRVARAKRPAARLCERDAGGCNIVQSPPAPVVGGLHPGSIEPFGHFVHVEPQESTPLVEGDPAFAHKSADVSDRDAEVPREVVDRDQLRKPGCSPGRSAVTEVRRVARDDPAAM
jgi:hypothetical protein